MGSRTVRIAVVIIAVAIVIAGLLILSGKNNNPSPSTSIPSENTVGSRRSTGNATAGDRIAIQNFSFSPANIVVKRGTRVIWTNRDSTAHTVTDSQGHAGPASPTLNHGQSYSFVFDRAGIFPYHCTIHPEMTGTVTVAP